jgi:hypothetical protein
VGKKKKALKKALKKELKKQKKAHKTAQQKPVPHGHKTECCDKYLKRESKRCKKCPLSH